MRGVNKVIIVGRLGNDPTTRQFQNGSSVTNISVATSEQWTDKQTGERRESTEWHRVSFFGRLAEIAGQYLKKGSAVYVEGSLRTNKYTDQNGIERFSTEIRADNLQMLDSNSNGNGGGFNQQNGGNFANGYQNQNQYNNGYGNGNGMNNNGFNGNGRYQNHQNYQDNAFANQNNQMNNQPMQNQGYNSNSFMQNAPAQNPAKDDNSTASSMPKAATPDEDIPF